MLIQFFKVPQSVFNLKLHYILFYTFSFNYLLLSLDIAGAEGLCSIFFYRDL